jgi:hypothetical protein
MNPPQLNVNCVNESDYLKVENRIEYSYCARNLINKKTLPQQNFETHNSPRGNNSFQINFNGLYDEPRREEFGNNEIYCNNEFICSWLKN